MPANRFFLDTEMKSGASLLIEGAEHHHLTHVMRIDVGEELELVNGRGDLGHGIVKAIGKKNSEIHLTSIAHEPPFGPSFFLAVPLMRPTKLEWIVEKGTELGATGFIFYPAAHSEKEDLSSRHLERLHLMAIGALKQSGRLYLPSLEIIASLEHVFVKEASFFFGDPRAKEPMALSAFKNQSLIFITGPEKGFSPEELFLLDHHARSVRLSRYILRAETAPIAAAVFLAIA